MVDSFEKSVSYRLAHAAKLHRARAAILLADIHLYPGQETILKALAAKDGQTMGDLAQMLSVRPPTITKMVARLSTQGLVERRGSQEGGDARLGYVHLTPVGYERAQQIDEIWKKLDRQSLSGLDTKERKRLRKLLRQVSKNLSQSDGTVMGDDQGDDDIAEL